MKIEEKKVVKRLREMARSVEGDSAVLASALFFLDSMLKQQARDIKSIEKRLKGIEQKLKRPKK